jgi:P27 family predicted phage terminase small subunit
MASPHPVPTHIKKLRGTDRPDRKAANPLTPEVMQDVPMAPAELPKKGQEVWYTCAMELKKYNALHKVDLEMLTAYCFQVSTMHEAMFHIKKHGKIMKLKNKAKQEYYQTNPWIGIYNNALTYANKLATQFGFTPSARTKISIGKPVEEKKNPFDGF